MTDTQMGKKNMSWSGPYVWGVAMTPARLMDLARHVASVAIPTFVVQYVNVHIDDGKAYFLISCTKEEEKPITFSVHDEAAYGQSVHTGFDLKNFGLPHRFALQVPEGTEITQAELLAGLIQRAAKQAEESIPKKWNERHNTNSGWGTTRPIPFL